MAKPFFEHATPQEHFNAINEADYAVQLAMIERDLLAVESAYRVNMALADYKVMTENGTFEDLQALYEEASAEKSEGSKGIFQRLLDLIQDIFGAFKKLIFGEQGKDFEKFINSDEAKNTKANEGVDMGAVDKSMNIVQRAFKRVKDFVSGNSSSNEASDGLVEDNNELGKTVGKIFAGVGGTVTLASLGALLWKHANGIFTFGDSITDCVNEAKEKGGSEFVGLLRGFLRGMKKFVVDGLVKIADIIQSSMKTTSAFLNTISKTDTFKGLPDALSAALGQLKDERADKRSSDLGDTLADLEQRLKNATTEAERKKIQKRIDRVKKRKDDIDYGRARRTKNFNFKDKEDAEKQIAALKDEIQKLKDEIDKLNNELDELNKQNAAESTVNAKEEEIDKKEDELDQKERELNDAEAQADELDKKGDKPDGPDDNDPPKNPPGGGGGGSSASSSGDDSSGSSSQKSGPKVPDDKDPLPTNNKWFNGSAEVDAGDLNEFCKVLNKYQPSALAKMDGKAIDDAEKDVSNELKKFNEWHKAAKADTSSMLSVALGASVTPTKQTKKVIDSVKNHQMNATLKRMVDAAKGRAQSILNIINGDGKNDHGLKGNAHYGDILPQNSGNTNAKTPLTELWKTRTLSLQDFQSAGMSNSQLTTLQGTIEAANKDDASRSAAGVKKGANLDTTLKNLKMHLSAGTAAQGEYEKLLAKASAANATPEDIENLDQYVANCKKHGINVGTLPTRVVRVSRGAMLKMGDTEIHNIQQTYLNHQKNQDAYGYSDGDKKNISDTLADIAEIVKGHSNAQQQHQSNPTARDKDPKLDSLLSAIEKPLQELLGVEFSVETDEKDGNNKKVTKKYKPTWDALYSGGEVVYSDAAMTNPVAHRGGSAPQYQSKYKQLVDALKTAVDAYKADPTWGKKPFQVHGSGAKVKAFVKESAFGIDFSSGLVLTESCNMIDLSRFDTEADDILDEMDNL